MSTPSSTTAKTASSAGAKTTTTTTVVKKTTTTAAKQPQQKTVRKTDAASKTKSASGKKVINAHHNASLAAGGLMRFSRGRMFHRRALYRLTKWKGAHAQLKEAETAGGKTKKTAGSIRKKQRPQALKKKPIGGERNGKERLVRAKRYPRYYPTEERPKKFVVKRKKFSSHPRRFRPSLTPGTVVILVAGKHAGKRAVVVKHLSSGLLLITGPHKLNGVPLRRMNQIYVIATSTKLDLSTAQLDDLDDKTFKRVRKGKKNAENDIFDSKKEKSQLSEDRRKTQRNVDSVVLNAIKAHADKRLLRRYLKSRFQLWNGVLPHKLQF